MRIVVVRDKIFGTRFHRMEVQVMFAHACIPSEGYPRRLQTTAASSGPQPSSQMVPHVLSRHTSTVPSTLRELFCNLTVPSSHEANVKMHFQVSNFSFFWIATKIK